MKQKLTAKCEISVIPVFISILKFMCMCKWQKVQYWFKNKINEKAK